MKIVDMMTGVETRLLSVSRCAKDKRAVDVLRFGCELWNRGVKDDFKVCVLRNEKEVTDFDWDEMT